MEPVDVSNKHFYISLTKSVVRLFGCYALFQSGLALAEGGNISEILMFTAGCFGLAEVLGIVEEL